MKACCSSVNSPAAAVSRASQKKRLGYSVPRGLPAAARPAASAPASPDAGRVGCVLPSRPTPPNLTTRYGHMEYSVKINAAEFKAKCLKLIDEVAATHEPLVITKRGKPVARLVPIEDENPLGLFGYMKGTGMIVGDIVHVPHEPWAAETGGEDHLYLPPTSQGDGA